MRNNLAIIVLMWNDYKNTIICLKTLLNQTYKCSNIFLVDNNSDDGSFEKVKNWLNVNYFNLFYNKKINKRSIISTNALKKFKIFIIRNNKNLGCGYGHNTGYALAIKNKFKFVSRIDNDMIVPKDFFKKIIKNFNNPLIQAISPKILYSKNKNLIWWKGTKIGNSLKFQTHMRDYPYGLKDNDQISGLTITDSIAGCASIMRAKRINQVGLSDKDFFYGPEDVEYSKRLFTKKGSLIVDLNSKIYHSEKKGSGSSFEVELCRNWHWMWSLYYYNLKHSGKFKAYTIAFNKFFSSIIKILFSLIVFNKKKYLMNRYRLSGLVYSILNKPSWIRPENIQI